MKKHMGSFEHKYTLLMRGVTTLVMLERAIVLARDALCFWLAKTEAKEASITLSQNAKAKGVAIDVVAGGESATNDHKKFGTTIVKRVLANPSLHAHVNSSEFLTMPELHQNNINKKEEQQTRHQQHEHGHRMK